MVVRKVFFRVLLILFLINLISIFVFAGTGTEGSTCSKDSDCASTYKCVLKSGSFSDYICTSSCGDGTCQ